MFDPLTLVYFMAASLLLIIAPGPDLAFLVAQGCSGGKKAGVATAMGLAAGNLFHTLGAALGVSIIFKTSPLAFEWLKFFGAVYLLYLAAVTLCTASRVDTASGGALFLRGLLMNLLNPKVALFFIAFLPLFVSGRQWVWLQMTVLGLLFTLMVVIVFGLIGVLAGHVSHWLTVNTRALASVKWLVAGLYVFLAVRLFFMTA